MNLYRVSSKHKLWYILAESYTIALEVWFAKTSSPVEPESVFLLTEEVLTKK
jgi:hypothetical protein